MAAANQVPTPWLHGVPDAAKYAGLGKDLMRALVKSGQVLSRKKPKDPVTGRRPIGVLVYAPSIDALLMEQPSGACEMAQRLVGAVGSE
jgi:hypothetical protein